LVFRILSIDSRHGYSGKSIWAAADMFLPPEHSVSRS